ncbi:hypothetical protein B1F73_22680 [Pseudomonas syringae]|nr:hypothetical protein B1F71_08785 [Pseudomonas syringae]RXT77579.1 hypothetical protein B1F77_11225 [Pseudomonas syringae]RXT86585.1 hypothetical protein B1F72_06765 [Pseudomonas syringae]RXT95269.1 hypothetical protein B1F73_22680 [Pseudomonas syringae]RXT97068.1 hypothetical protein B1F75_03660 [Pseudomonas syringae]
MLFCVRNTAFANKLAPTEYAVPCGSELAREESGAVHCFSASGIPPSRTSSLLREYAVPCGSELAREESGAVDGFSASGIPPSRTSSLLREYAVSCGSAHGMTP